MIESKYINCIIATLMTVAVVFTTALMLSPGIFAAAEPEYVSKVFNKDRVTQVNIDIRQEDFDWIIENATKKEYRSCDITINGTTFKHVGIRPKGNPSLTTATGAKNAYRFSFKIKFDAYINGQTCFGLNKMAINNIIMDKTYMKEYLSYDMFDSMGVVTPVYTYSNITVNGEPWGLYLAVEAMDECFVQRNYGSLIGRLYRPDGTGSELKWTGVNDSNYSGIRNNAAYDVTESDFNKVITMISNLNYGTDLDKYLDVDSILRYFAVNTFLVNLESYTGNKKNNYYLYEENGLYTILPWDLNRSFAGNKINKMERAVNFPIDAPVITNLSDSLLIGNLLEVPEYKELYHKYLSDIVSSYVDSGVFENNMQKVDSLINDHVRNSVTAFYTYAEYQNALPVLLEFVKQRAASITGQLAGLPSPTYTHQGSMGSYQNTTYVSGGPNNNEVLTNIGRGNINIRYLLGNGGGVPPGDGSMPIQEIMAEIMKNIQDADGYVPTNEQAAGFTELWLTGMRLNGVNDSFSNPPGNMENNQPCNMNTGSRISPVQILHISASTIFILLGLLFVWKYKRRKYCS